MPSVCAGRFKSKLIKCGYMLVSISGKHITVKIGNVKVPEFAIPWDLVEECIAQKMPEYTLLVKAHKWRVHSGATVRQMRKFINAMCQFLNRK